MATTETKRYHEQSAITDIYTEPDAGPPYTIHFDQWFTRRKRFHVITDRRGAVVFRSRWVADLHTFLDIKGPIDYQARIGDLRYVVSVTPILVKRKTTK